jgi:hypothetical protein
MDRCVGERPWLRSARGARRERRAGALGLVDRCCCAYGTPLQRPRRLPASARATASLKAPDKERRPAPGGPAAAGPARLS